MIIQDVVIPFHQKDAESVQYSCKYLQETLNIRQIFLISKEDPKIENTVHFSESDINDIISLEEITNIWKKNNLKYSYRAGWIYQQLLKLGANQIIDDLSENFLISDADIIFLNNPYENVKEESFPYGQAYTGEYHEPYRKNYERLMKQSAESGFSFINHHMIFNKKYLNNLKKFIEEKNNKRWDLAIIDSLDFNSFSDFSEYDLYGNWMFKNNKDKMIKLNYKIKDINILPSETEINIAKEQGYHILSSQAWNR